MIGSPSYPTRVHAQAKSALDKVTVDQLNDANLVSGILLQPWHPERSALISIKTIFIKLLAEFAAMTAKA